MVIRQAATLFIFPFLYFASVVPVVAVLLVVFTLEEQSIGFNQYNSVYFNGDITAVASLLVIGSLVFGGCSRALVWLEGMTRPTLADHLRHCAFIYAFVGILGALIAVELIGNLIAGIPMYMPKVVVVWVVAAYAILVDGLILVRERQPFGRASLGARP